MQKQCMQIAGTECTTCKSTEQLSTFPTARIDARPSMESEGMEQMQSRTAGALHIKQGRQERKAMICAREHMRTACGNIKTYADGISGCGEGFVSGFKRGCRI